MQRKKLEKNLYFYRHFLCMYIDILTHGLFIEQVSGTLLLLLFVLDEACGQSVCSHVGGFSSSLSLKSFLR